MLIALQNKKKVLLGQDHGGTGKYGRESKIHPYKMLRNTPGLNHHWPFTQKKMSQNKGIFMSGPCKHGNIFFNFVHPENFEKMIFYIGAFHNR